MTDRCFFYITNDWTSSATDIVFSANDRCNQENLIQQHKHGVPALTAPLDSLNSNWAYMVMASLAWSLKAWSALVVSRQCAMAREARSREATFAADGLRHLPQRLHQHPGADCSDEAQDRVSLAGVELLARGVLPPGGPSADAQVRLTSHP